MLFFIVIIKKCQFTIQIDKNDNYFFKFELVSMFSFVLFFCVTVKGKVCISEIWVHLLEKQNNPCK